MWWIILIGIVMFFVFSLIVVGQNEAIVVERFGKFHGIFKAGLQTVYVPIYSVRGVDWSFKNAEANSFTSLKAWRIPLSVLRYDPKPHNCQTSDNFSVSLDVVMNFKVADVKKAVYMNYNVFADLEDKFETRLYEVMRSFKFTELDLIKIKERFNVTEFNEQLASGIVIEEFRVQKIIYPKGIVDATVSTQTLQIQHHAEIERLKSEREHELMMLASKRDELMAKQELERLTAEHEREMHLKEAESKQAITRLSMSANYELWDRLKDNPGLVSLLMAQEQSKAAIALGKGGKGKKLIIMTDGKSSLGGLPVIKELLSQ